MKYDNMTTPKCGGICIGWDMPPPHGHGHRSHQRGSCRFLGDVCLFQLRLVGGGMAQGHQARVNHAFSAAARASSCLPRKYSFFVTRTTPDTRHHALFVFDKRHPFHSRSNTTLATCYLLLATCYIRHGCYLRKPPYFPDLCFWHEMYICQQRISVYI